MADDDLIHAITIDILLETFLIILLSFILIRFIRFFIPRIANQFSSRRRLSILLFIPILRFLTILMMLLLLFRLYLVTTEQNLLAILGALAIAIGFAFKDYLSNLIAGMIIMYELPFRPGDWIEVNGIYGEVRSIGLRNLELWTPDDTIVKIPQSTFWNTPIFNTTSGEQTVQCVIEFFLESKTDPNEVRSLLIDCVYSSILTQFDKKPVVLVEEFPGYTKYKVRAYPIDSRDQFIFKTDITIRAKELFNDRGIESIHFINFNYFN